jgi:hypothetical protein
MDKDVFLKTYRPHLKVIFNSDKFLQDQTAVVNIKRFDRKQYGRFLNPWYLNRSGGAANYDEREGHPIPVREALRKLDRVGHADHVAKIEALTELLKGDNGRVYDPLMPVVGVDKRQTHFVFDGNHRLCAAHEVSQPGIYVVLVESDIMTELNPDFRLHS